MTSRFDELFSPEQLQKNWQRVGASPETETNGPDSPAAILARMRHLVRNNFPEEGIKAIDIVLDELGTLMPECFPQAGDETANAEKRLNALSTSHAILDRLEDLVAAFEAG